MRVRGNLAPHLDSTGRVVRILLVLLGAIACFKRAVAVGSGAIGTVGRGLLRIGCLQFGEEVGRGCCGLVHGHVELFLGEEALERVGRGLELGVHGAGFSFAEGRAYGYVIATRGTGRIVIVCLEQLALALVVLPHILSITKLVACPARLAWRLRPAGTLGVTNAELVGVQQHGVAIRKVQLLFLALQTHGARLDCGHEAFADGGGEQFVLLFGDVHFIEVGILDLILGVLVLVLHGIAQSVRRLRELHGAHTYPEHGKVAIAILYRVVDRIDKASIVFPALSDIVCASTGCSWHGVAHDGRNELSGFFACILERLVGIRVCLENEANVGLERGELGAIVAVSIVGEGGHHLGQLVGEHVAPLVALGDLWLWRACTMAKSHVLWGQAAITCHGTRLAVQLCKCGKGVASRGASRRVSRRASRERASCWQAKDGCSCRASEVTEEAGVGSARDTLQSR